MPKVEDIFSKLNGANYFSTLDLWAGYHNIPLDKSSIPKMAFNSLFGKYEYVKVPFGLTPVPAYFQELMTGILKGFDFAIIYLDDIITFSTTVEEHLSHIKQVFEKLQTAKLSLKFSKCHSFTKEIQYLGHILSTKAFDHYHQNSSHPEHASTQNIQTSLCLSWFSRILQKIYQELCQNSQIINVPNPSASKIWLDTNSS